jgi:hypothetical protein
MTSTWTCGWEQTRRQSIQSERFKRTAQERFAHLVFSISQTFPYEMIALTVFGEDGCLPFVSLALLFFIRYLTLLFAIVAGIFTPLHSVYVGPFSSLFVVLSASGQGGPRIGRIGGGHLVRRSTFLGHAAASIRSSVIETGSVLPVIVVPIDPDRLAGLNTTGVG